MRHQRQSAFSLFELVVATSLLVILLVSLSMIFSAGLGVYRTFGRGLGPFDAARLGYSQIETDLNSQIGGTNLFRGGTGPVRMDFITKTPEGEILAVRYQYDANAKTLSRFTEITDSQTLPANIAANPDVLIERVTNCNFTFYGGTPNGIRLDDADSSPQWADPDAPAAVRVELSMQDANDVNIVETFARLFAIRNQE